MPSQTSGDTPHSLPHCSSLASTNRSKPCRDEITNKRSSPSDTCSKNDPLININRWNKNGPRQSDTSSKNKLKLHVHEIWIEYLCENYENKMDQALNYNIMPIYNGTSVKLILPKYPKSISPEYVYEFQKIPVNSVPCPRVRCRGTFRRRWQRSRCGRLCWRPRWSPGPAPGNTYRPIGSYTTTPSSRSSQNSTRLQSHL